VCYNKICKTNKTNMTENAHNQLHDPASHPEAPSTIQSAGSIGNLIGGATLDIVPVPEAVATPNANWVTDENGVNTSVEASVRTTLPTEIFDFDGKDRLFIPASGLDKLTSGTYTIEQNGASAVLTIIEANGGTYVGAKGTRNDKVLFPAKGTVATRSLPTSFGGYGIAESLSSQLSGVDGDVPSTRLLEKFGYYIDRSLGSRLIPTPNTVRDLVQKNNAPIEIIDASGNNGTISGKAYLEAFGRGNYPIGTGDLGIYAHDVRSNDHTAGVLATGPDIMNTLAPLANAVLQQDRIDEFINFFDVFTSQVSRLIDTPENEYLSKAGMDPLAIALNDLLNICSSYKSTAKKLDVEPVDLLTMFKTRLAELSATNDLGDKFNEFVAATVSLQMNPEVVLDKEPEKEYLFG
jgi:hypothetical protein